MINRLHKIFTDISVIGVSQIDFLWLQLTKLSKKLDNIHYEITDNTFNVCHG